MFLCSLILLQVAAATAAAVRSHRNNVIFWVSEPVLPGETALISIASTYVQHQTDPVQIYARQLATSPFTPLKVQGETEYGVSATIPTTYAIGEFELQVRRGNATGPPYRANIPRPWFVFGDQGDTSTPGGFIRVIGDGISLPSAASYPSFDRTMKKLGLSAATAAAAAAATPVPQVFLTPTTASTSSTPNGFATIQVAGTNLTRSHATFHLPTNIAPGTYTIHVSNALTGTRVPICTFLTPSVSCLSTVNITEPRQLPSSSKRCTVQAPQPGYGRNATLAVHAALSDCGLGGTIYFPRGQYFIHGPILVPEGCVLQGERRDMVSVFFFEQNQTTAPAAYITGATNTTQSFGIADLTVYVTSFAKDIIRFQPATNGGFVKRIRMRFNSYFALEPITGQSSRGRNTSWPHSVGTAVMLAGKNVQIVDNDIYSSGDVVSTLYNGMPGGSYFHIARNRFWNGGTTHWYVSFFSLLSPLSSKSFFSMHAMSLMKMCQLFFFLLNAGE